jgi:hypothetical protein
LLFFELKFILYHFFSDSKMDYDPWLPSFILVSLQLANSFSVFFFSCKVRITSILKSKLKISQNNSISIFSSPNLQAIFILQSPELNEVKIMFSFNIILPAFKNLTLKYECWHLSLYIFIYWRSEAWTNPIDWGEK